MLPLILSLNAALTEIKEGEHNFINSISADNTDKKTRPLNDDYQIVLGVYNAKFVLDQLFNVSFPRIYQSQNNTE